MKTPCLLISLMALYAADVCYAASFSIAQNVDGQYVFCKEPCPLTEKILDIPRPTPAPAAEVRSLPPQGEVAKKVHYFRIQFPLNSSSITPKAASILAEVSRSAKDAALIEIVGHTDKLGKRPLNKWLALQRARSVRRFLVNRGVDATRISLDSSCCIEHPPVCNPAARRVEIKVVR